MRLASILEEAWLNLKTGTSRAGLFTIALALLLGIFAVAEAATVASLEDRALAFRNAGGTTLIYDAVGEVNGTACDNLATVPGVQAAGALRTAPSNETATALPSTTIPTFDVTPTFGGFTALNHPAANRGVLVSATLAQTLGVRAGQNLKLTTGTTRVGAVYAYAEDGRTPGFGYAIFVPTPVTGPFDQCWVETWPQSTSMQSLLPTVLLPGSATTNSPPPQTSQLNSSLGVSFDGATLFRDRLTQYSPIIAALVAFALGYISVRMRRLELASARHSGVGFTAQATQIAIETATWIAAASVLALPSIIAITAVDHSPEPGTIILLGTRVVLAGAGAAFLGALTSVIVTRERHLFRYFKER